MTGPVSDCIFLLLFLTEVPLYNLKVLKGFCLGRVKVLVLHLSRFLLGINEFLSGKYVKHFRNSTAFIRHLVVYLRKRQIDNKLCIFESDAVFLLHFRRLGVVDLAGWSA